jgi:hypothetical protein
MRGAVSYLRIGITFLLPLPLHQVGPRYMLADVTKLSGGFKTVFEVNLKRNFTLRKCTTFENIIHQDYTCFMHESFNFIEVELFSRFQFHFLDFSKLSL